MVAVKTDDKGNATEVLEVRNVKGEELNSLKKKVSEHLAEEQKLAEEQIKFDKVKDNKLYIKSIAIAKTLFNELVDSGKAGEKLQMSLKKCLISLLLVQALSFNLYSQGFCYFG